MHGLTAAALLAAWERGALERPVERALTVLSFGDPEADERTYRELSPGRRDAALLELRARTLGERMDAVVPCPRCGEQLELALETDDVRTELPPEPAARLTARHAGDTFRIRLPDSADLSAAAAMPDLEAARAELLERCLLSGPTPLPEGAAEAISARMAEADPQVDVRLELTCPECGHAWQSTLDVNEFFWAEIEQRAGRLTRDVDTLARAYGWSEREILDLSTPRRRLYVELAEG